MQKRRIERESETDGLRRRMRRGRRVRIARDIGYSAKIGKKWASDARRE